MAKIQFTGRVFPIDTVMLVVPPVALIGGNVKGEMSIRIENSVLQIDGDVDHYTEESLLPLYLAVYQFVRSVIDAIVFATGHGLLLSIDMFTGPDGGKKNIRSFDAILEPVCTHSVISILVLSEKEPEIALALNDLAETLERPHDAVVGCARAIERIRHQVAPGMDRKPQWNAMRDSLNISKDYIDMVTALSAAPRHGDSKQPPGAETIEARKRAWVIMNRFLEFRKRNNQPLPLSEFPLLA